MKSEIQKITDTPGIVAILRSKSGSDEFSQPTVTDNKEWKQILGDAMRLLSLSGEDEVKVTLDKHTVVVQRSGDIVLGVVVVKSHPVVKSLKRMIRRAFREEGHEVLVESKRHLGEPRTVGGHVPGDTFDKDLTDEVPDPLKTTIH